MLGVELRVASSGSCARDFPKTPLRTFRTVAKPVAHPRRLPLTYLPRMKFPLCLAVLAVLLAGCSTCTMCSSKPTGASSPTSAGPAVGTVDAEGFTTIFDGSWTNWRVGERPESWSIVNGAFRANGDRSHNFYYGPLAPFTDFELKVDVKTVPGSNGGIYIHTKYQDEGWPFGGYEIQVNNTHTDWRKTGSVYAVQDVKEQYAQDNVWWTQHIIVKGNNIKVYIDGKLVNDYTEEAGRQPGKDFERKLSSGTIALQAHDPKSVVLYKNIRVKKL